MTKFAKHVRSLFPFSVVHVTLTFPSTLKAFFFFRDSHVITLPVSCQIQDEKVRGNFRNKVNYRCYCHCPGLEFILLLEGLPKEFLLLGKLYGKIMAGHVVISEEVDALQYVVVNRAEKHVPHGELVRNTERIAL